MKAIHVVLKSNLAGSLVMGAGMSAVICAVGALGVLGACVPTGSAPPYDAGAQPTATATVRPSLNVMTTPFEDNFDRPDDAAGLGPTSPPTSSTTSASASSSAWPAFDASAGSEGGLTLVTRDGAARDRDGGAESVLLPMVLQDGGDGGASAEHVVDHSNLGPNWTQAKTSAWRVEGGKLCVQNAHNHGIWLNRTLPVNARIEFEATGYSDDGDLKAEVWGDGVSYATGTSYTNATSYLAILGGWKNSIHALARLNEHGTDRKEIHVDKDSDDPRQRPAQKGQTYHFKIERADGKTIRWSVDGIDFLTWNDPSPLAGLGHDHFGFNEWEAKVCFDNVKVTPL